MKELKFLDVKYGDVLQSRKESYMTFIVLLVHKGGLFCIRDIKAAEFNSVEFLRPEKIKDYDVIDHRDFDWEHIEMLKEAANVNDKDM